MTDLPASTDPPTPPTGVDDAAFTLAYLQTHEEECPACGYNVHRLTEPRCPECGRTLVVKVVSTLRGFSVPWIVSLIIFGFAAGIGLLVAAVVLREGFHEHGALRFVLLYFMANMPLPLILLAVRRWFIRMPMTLQSGLMAATALATTALFIWFILLIER